MPTKRPRLNVTFPEQTFYNTVFSDAAISRRSMSDQIIWILDQHYAERRKEASLFTPSQLSEGKRVPVFEDAPPPLSGRASKPRESLARGES